MNWGQAALAGGAGLLSLAIFVGGGLAATRLSFTQFGLVPFGGGQTLNLAVAVLGILAVSVAVAVALALPAFALGASWKRSLAAACLGGLLFIFLLILVVLPTAYKAAWIFVAMAATPTLITSIAVMGMMPGATRPILLLWAVATVFCASSLILYAAFPQTPIPSLGMVFIAWPGLPTLAALMVSR